MLPDPETSGVSVAANSRCSVPWDPPWLLQMSLPSVPDVRSNGATWVAVHALPWSVDLETNRPVLGLGVMFAVDDCQYAYRVPLLSMVSDGALLPKLAARSGRGA